MMGEKLLWSLIRVAACRVKGTVGCWLCLCASRAVLQSPVSFTLQAVWPPVSAALGVG